jgi:hypothetical protein
MAVKRKTTRRVSKKSVTKRGSEKLLASGTSLTEKDLSQILRISSKRNVKLVNWCIYGQPAPDGVCGEFQVSPTIATSVIRDLIRLRNIRVGLEVFPYGIPVPDGVMVRFNSRMRGM